ncbi:hypothetical protein DOTSEDRAFT_72345 [Dothistroma septosporum NZE10]|uniref:Uncharacterized protein n=1 Tax=Dothistroma septosporum (strain NZE10 / CBS 128990) TaxID=675120 RepID=M2Y3J7_DOTSN|nr:hypothetical protein DOTSEDRAFT_72345 [Dothistroma septosporum NZE10]
MKAPHGSKTPEWEETPEEQETNNMKQMDAYYASIARKYFTSGAHIGTSTRLSRHGEPDFERDVGDMMFYLKDEVMRKLDNERWLYEPIDRVQPALS